MPYVCHIPKLLKVHQWGKNAKYHHMWTHWHKPCDQESCTQMMQEHDADSNANADNNDDNEIQKH